MSYSYLVSAPIIGLQTCRDCTCLNPAMLSIIHELRVGVLPQLVFEMVSTCIPVIPLAACYRALFSTISMFSTTSLYAETNLLMPLQSRERD
jgi:hypothetical protein